MTQHPANHHAIANAWSLRRAWAALRDTNTPDDRTPLRSPVYGVIRALGSHADPTPASELATGGPLPADEPVPVAGGCGYVLPERTAPAGHTGWLPEVPEECYPPGSVPLPVYLTPAELEEQVRDIVRQPLPFRVTPPPAPRPWWRRALDRIRGAR